MEVLDSPGFGGGEEVVDCVEGVSWELLVVGVVAM